VDSLSELLSHLPQVRAMRRTTPLSNGVEAQATQQDKRELCHDKFTTHAPASQWIKDAHTLHYKLQHIWSNFI